MDSFVIPLSSVPSQKAQVTLGGQACRYWVRQLETGLYIDLWLNGEDALAGALCVDRVDLLRGRVPQLAGRLYFLDTRGKSDPIYTGLATRYQFIFEG